MQKIVMATPKEKINTINASLEKSGELNFYARTSLKS